MGDRETSTGWSEIRSWAALGMAAVSLVGIFWGRRTGAAIDEPLGISPLGVMPRMTKQCSECETSGILNALRNRGSRTCTMTFCETVRGTTRCFPITYTEDCSLVYIRIGGWQIG
jgi:hypothetical protein